MNFNKLLFLTILTTITGLVPSFCYSAQKQSKQDKQSKQSKQSKQVKKVSKLSKKERAFLNAARDGNVKQVRDFLLYSPSLNINAINEYGNNALMLAAVKGHEDVVKLLLNRNANKNQKNVYGDTALDLALAGKRKSIVKLILKESLIEAQKKQDLKRVAELLKHPYINEIDFSVKKK